MKFRFFHVNRDPDPADNQGGGGDPTPPDNNPESVGANVDHKPGTEDPQYTSPDLNMAEAIPPQFRDKEYFKDITFERLINDHVNLQSKLGQRPPVGVPDANATPEQVEQFYSTLRPKEASEYEFPETDFSKEKGRDEHFTTGMREVFHKAGISKHQAKILTEGFDAYTAGRLAESLKADEQFDTKITEIYGDKRDEALTRAKNLMKENIPEDMKPLLDTLPNNALLLLTTTLNKVHDKYIKEDSITPTNQPGSDDPTALQEEARRIMQSEDFKDFRRPGYDKAQKRVTEIYNRIAALQGSNATTVQK